METLTRSVVPNSQSRTKISLSPLVSPLTRLVASDENATKRPSALIEGRSLEPFAEPPVVETLTSSMV